MAVRGWGWLVDVVAGGLVGLVVAGVAALNLMIYFGPDTGYQTGLDALFAHSPLVGSVVVAVLVGGPILGILLARRMRRQRDGH